MVMPAVSIPAQTLTPFLGPRHPPAIIQDTSVGDWLTYGQDSRRADELTGQPTDFGRVGQPRVLSLHVGKRSSGAGNGLPAAFASGCAKKRAIMEPSQGTGTFRARVGCEGVR